MYVRAITSPAANSVVQHVALAGVAPVCGIQHPRARARAHTHLSILATRLCPDEPAGDALDPRSNGHFRGLRGKGRDKGDVDSFHLRIFEDRWIRVAVSSIFKRMDG
jgi:hypothetical protein